MTNSDQSSSFKVAFVITTYNQPKSLGIVLKTLLNQSYLKFDLFIADDGSGHETKDKIEEYRPYFLNKGIKLHHFWHEDLGYRKAKINNEVFRNLRGYDLMIAIDHDCFCHPDFVLDHVASHKSAIKKGHEHRLFMGRRVECGPLFVQKISEQNVLQFNQGMTLSLFFSRLNQDSENIDRSIRIPFRWLRTLLHKNHVPDLMGCNFSISVPLLFLVNGYDEAFRGYWGEDGDLFIRVRNVGAYIFGSKSLAIQFHLWHPRLEPTAENLKSYQEKIKDRSYLRCKLGVFS